jgi:hypothetical protein
MRNKLFMTTAAAAMLALPILSAQAGPKAGLGNAFPQTCAAGYHTDAGGNCQPKGGETSRYCPPGTVFEPTFDGWNCEPAPPEAY